MRLKSILVATVLCVGAIAAVPVRATFINGDISFSDRFPVTETSSSITATSSSIVSGLTFIEAGASLLAQACSGVFGAPCIPNSGTSAYDFTIGASSILFSYNGFDFLVTAFSPITRTGLACSGPPNAHQCADSLFFTATGTVTHAGFDPTPFRMSWSGHGTCNESSVVAGQCDAAINTASWSASIVAASVPEPATAALLGLGLGLFGLVLRRRKA